VPVVSVIIPAYNHVRFVGQCIDSVLTQTYTDYEVVVVDDGSQDGTSAILQGYGDRIVYIRQENAGTQAARNRAIRASTGEFIALLDSDDAWLPMKLQRQLAAFDARPDVGMIYALAYAMDEAGNIAANMPARQ